MQRLLAFFLISTLLPASYAARNLDRNLGWPGETLSGVQCQGKDINFGPYDYADPEVTRRGGKYAYKIGGSGSPLALVENAHFTEEVEQLITGKTGKDPAGDIDYTLRAFPNHHKALWSYTRYFLRRIRGLDDLAIARVEMHPKGFPPPECYFNRAEYFAPEDPMVSAIYGVYLHRRGKLDAALEKYTRAEKDLPNFSELIYNIGLLHVDMNNLEKAQAYAKRARELGYPLDGLQRKISRRLAEK